MVLVFVLVYAMACLVLLQDLVQARSLDVVALPDHVLTVVQGLLMVLLLLDQLFIEVQLADKGLTCTGVEDVDNAGFDHLMEPDGVVPAVVEDLQDFRINHHISNYFPGEPEGFEVSLLVHVPNVDEESIFAIIQLNHLDEPSFPEVSFQINSQNFARQNMRSTRHQRLEVVYIVRLSFFQFLEFVHLKKQLFLFIGILIRTFAWLEFHLLEYM